MAKSLRPARLACASVLVIVLALASSSGRAAIVGDWHLNESAGSGTVSDSAAPPSDGTLSGSPPPMLGAASVPLGQYGALNVTMPANFGTALQLDQANNSLQNVNLSNPPELNLTGNFTWMGWVNPATLAANTVTQRVFGTGRGGADGWNFGFRGETVRFTANGIVDQDFPGVTGTNGQWMHLALTVAEDGATPRLLTGYVNGNQVYQQTLGASGIIRPSTSVEYRIGAAGSGGAFEGFNGLMDEVKLYNEVLTVDQIRAAAIPVPEPTALPLAAALVGLLRRRR
jgi:hypothetical protein